MERKLKGRESMRGIEHVKCFTKISSIKHFIQIYLGWFDWLKIFYFNQIFYIETNRINFIFTIQFIKPIIHHQLNIIKNLWNIIVLHIGNTLLSTTWEIITQNNISFSYQKLLISSISWSKFYLMDLTMYRCGIDCHVFTLLDLIWTMKKNKMDKIWNTKNPFPQLSVTEAWECNNFSYNSIRKRKLLIYHSLSFNFWENNFLVLIFSHFYPYLLVVPI